ncbi:MAG: DUF1571 domain-containing protein [Planctomycetes bacterium]|nr:DUF1571 domain-containing protein [Planctomycetota bacterium]
MRRNHLFFHALPLTLVAASCFSTFILAEDSPLSREDLTEPVLRVAKATAPNPGAHPLDPALDLARDGLKTIRGNIADYTCTLVKRERINGELSDYEYIFTKVRNRKVVDGKVVTPFSVYMYFLKPSTVKGREVMYIEGQNDDKMIAHEGGTAGKYLPTVWLRPNGLIAMRGQLYPLTDVGLENLVLKLIERGEREKKAAGADCEVTFHQNAKINGRVCTLLQIKHEKPAPNVEFHMAHIFIDEEHQVPVRYAAYGFPAAEGEKPPVLEEYTYLDLKFNVGLTDQDFNHTNQDYKFQ